ncbi:MAG: Fic family protein [Flavobacteriales bacterium]
MLPSSYAFYTMHSRMLNLLTSIYHHLGEVQARHLQVPAPGLERAYRVSTVHATLALEGNPLEPLPVAELVSHPTATAGPTALEAVNTQRAHELLPELDPFMALDLRQAHGVLMHGLAMDAGQFRTGSMEVVYGDPPPIRTASADNMPALVEELLNFVEDDDAPPIITSCLLHFGLVYLRPFTAGNGRMARLWQRRVLMRHWPVFAFLPVEAFIQKTQTTYYASLEFADRQGDCGSFVTYLLERIDEALAELLAMPDPVRKAADRIALFLAQAPDRPFRRKEYMTTFPRLSTASASRDLRNAVVAARLVREGDGRTAVYRRVA